MNSVQPVSVRGSRRAGGADETLLEGVQRRLDIRANRVIERLLLADRLQYVRVIRLDERIQFPFESLAVGNRVVVEILVRAGEDQQDLFLNRQRLELILFQDFHQSLAARQLRLRGFIQLVGAELRE